MRDLTVGSLARHLLTIASTIASTLLATTLFLIVDLYFVAQLGEAALAGVSATANITLIVLGVANALALGASVAISHAAGRNDRSEANRIFNQAITLALAIGTLLAALSSIFAETYLRATLSDNAGAMDAALMYLRFLTPSFVLQIVLASLRAGLRGIGTITPAMITQFAAIGLNIALAPVLVLGWGTGMPLGAAGAGLATSLAFALSVAMLLVHFRKRGVFLQLDLRLWRPLRGYWSRILAVGAPAGGEALIAFLEIGFVYWLIRDFGSTAQAGFGLGSRVVQALTFPAMALAYAVVPIAGQSLGAGKVDRVRETFITATLSITAFMAMLTLLSQSFAHQMLSAFTEDRTVVAHGHEFLISMSWAFVLNGVIATCSSTLQAMGETPRVLLGTSIRTIVFASLGVWAMGRANATLQHVWLVWLLALFAHATVAAMLLSGRLRALQAGAVQAQVIR